MDVLETDLLGLSDRERILQAMAEICAKEGFQGISVEQVTYRAGVERDAFERFFADLEDCALALVNALLGEALSVIGSSYSTEKPEWESGVRAIRGLLELLAAQPSFAYFGYIVARQMAPPHVRLASENAFGAATAMLERLWEDSESEVQPRRAGRAALGGAEALVRREIAAGRTEQLPRLLPQLTYAVTVPFFGLRAAIATAGRAQEMLRGTVWE